MVDAEAEAALRRAGVPPMDPEPALEVLRQALDDDETHLVVGDFDWARFSAVYGFERARPLLRALPEATGPAGDGTAVPDVRADEGAGGERLSAERLAALPVADQEQTLVNSSPNTPPRSSATTATRSSPTGRSRTSGSTP